MYYYIYDAFLADKKYQPILAKIETRLTDLGINGKINRLSFLKNINSALIDEINKGAETIVIVGNDKTVSQIINLTADLNIAIGIIPVGPKNNIARVLGIPEGEKACDVLSARIIDKLDLGLVNNNYFLTSVALNNQEALFECDGQYTITSETKNCQILISNLSTFSQKTSPNDNYLDLIIKNVEKKFFSKDKVSLSRFQAQHIKIISPKTASISLIDENRIVKTPLEIAIVPKKLKIIVGKRRGY